MQNLWRLLPLVVIILVLQVVLISSSLLPSPIVQSVDWQADPQKDREFQVQLTQLIDQVGWIGRGRVVASHSFWNTDHTAIESDHTVAVYYTITGQTTVSITVRLAGGYLPAEKLGMVDTRTPTLDVGEEVLLFLQKEQTIYRVVGRERGKFTIIDDNAANAFGREQWSLAELYPLIEAELDKQERSSNLPADWAIHEPQVKAAVTFDPENFVYLNLKWETNSIKFKININTNQAGGSNGSVQEFQDAIIAGATLWSMIAEADFSMLADGSTTITEPTLNSKNEIMFIKRGAGDIAGQGRLWYTENRIIKEADMWLNDDHLWDTTGSPATNEVDLQSVALHEFGHWLGLGHDPDKPAVMYSTLTLGTTKRELSTNDTAGITYIYPCASAPCQPNYTPTATPTPTFTPPPTFTPTPDPQQTSIATPTFSSTAPPGQIGTATATDTVTVIPTSSPLLTPSPRSTNQAAESVYLPVVQK